MVNIAEIGEMNILLVMVNIAEIVEMNGKLAHVWCGNSLHLLLYLWKNLKNAHLRKKSLLLHPTLNVIFLRIDVKFFARPGSCQNSTSTTLNARHGFWSDLFCARGSVFGTCEIVLTTLTSNKIGSHFLTFGSEDVRTVSLPNKFMSNWCREWYTFYLHLSIAPS